MAADGGGNFGGDGSVNWKVISGEDNELKHKCKKNGNRRDCHGTDDDFGLNFRISIKVPTDPGARDAFIKLFPWVRASDARVDFELPIELGEPEQIRIRWGTGTSDTSTAT